MRPAPGPLAAFANGSANTITLYNGNLYFNGPSGQTSRSIKLNGNGTETITVPTGDSLELDGALGYGTVTAQYGVTFTGGGTLLLGGSGVDNNGLGMNILAGTVIITKSTSSTAHGSGGAPTALAPGATLQLSGSGNYDLYSGCTLYVSNGAVLDLGGQSDAFTTLYIAGNGTGIRADKQPERLLDFPRNFVDWQHHHLPAAPPKVLSFLPASSRATI